MNMSSSADFRLPVTMLKYRDMKSATVDDERLQPGAGAGTDTTDGLKDVRLTKAEFAERIARERTSAASEMEQKLRNGYEEKLSAARGKIAAAIASFEQERDKYFAKVEAEIVQLALAIAAKILHREAQVDPMLVAALVRIAIDNMREGSKITIRVSAGKGEAWREYFSGTSVSQVDVAEDTKLTDADCVVETELGSANFSIEKQLKEVEQGFFDLLALRPSAP
jgi:flagellar assembly protein FliH